MKENLKRRDYHSYCWEKGELFGTVLQAVGVTMFFAWFFYRSLFGIIVTWPVGILFFRQSVQRKKERCCRELLSQFKECIMSVATALKAGYAVENAFLESRKDMAMLYGERSYIYRELELIRRGQVINITLEELLGDFAQRSNVEEIRQFAKVFSIAKRSGGNMSDIISGTAAMIGRKIEVRQEIYTLLSGRRMEQLIMKAMPFAIVFYINLTYPGFFDGLYGNWQGAAIMTACLAVYCVAYLMSDKVMDRIEKEIMS